MKQTQIGLGMAAIGRPEYINIRTTINNDKTENAFRENAFELLDYAYQQGIRYFDTAPSYGKGELFLSEWHNQRNFPDVRIGTKWGYTYVADWQLGFDGEHEIKEHSVSKLIEQWAVSQQRFSNIAYYQIHSATFESGVLDNPAVLNHLMELKQRYALKIGLTTTGHNQSQVIEKALSLVIDNKKVFDSIQITYNIFEQSTFETILKAQQKGITIIIKEALANGRVFTNQHYPQYANSYEVLTALAQKYHVGVDAIALRFVIDSITPDYVLSGASNQNQLTKNLKALHFKLSPSEIKTLQNLAVSPDVYWSERKQLTWN